MMKGTFLKLFVGVFLLACLAACGGGGGGSDVVVTPPPETPPETPPATTLSGTVTDTALAQLAGVTVEILGTSSTATTDTAGRYSFSELPASTEYILKFNSPGPSYFTTFAKATLVENSPTVLDVYLARGGDNPAPTVEASVGGTVDSTYFIGAGQLATLTLAADQLVNSGGATYGGTADVYLAPIDVGRLGYGLASYQTTLGNVFASLSAGATMPELYGAAALRLTDTAGNELTFKTPSTATLEIPVPASPAELRASAPAAATLWYVDESTGAKVADGTATLDVSGEFYTGVISRPGIWGVGTLHDYTSLTEISGHVTYSNATSAAGVMVYVNGVDYAYQNQTTTDTDGNFALVAKALGTVTIHCVVAANGAQWTYEENFTNPTTVNIGLPYTAPVAGAAAQQTVIVDSRDSGIGQAPDVIGYILSSGRQVFDLDSADDPMARNVANVTFVANALPLVGPITLEPSLNGGGIQQVTGKTFESMTAAPASGYHASPTTYAIDLSAVTPTAPILVAVRTAQNHYAKISIDAVSPLDSFDNAWQITFRHAFSLTGNF